MKGLYDEIQQLKNNPSKDYFLFDSTNYMQIEIPEKYFGYNFIPFITGVTTEGNNFFVDDKIYNQGVRTSTVDLNIRIDKLLEQVNKKDIGMPIFQIVFQNDIYDNRFIYPEIKEYLELYQCDKTENGFTITTLDDTHVFFKFCVLFYK